VSVYTFFPWILSYRLEPQNSPIFKFEKQAGKPFAMENVQPVKDLPIELEQAA